MSTRARWLMIVAAAQVMLLLTIIAYKEYWIRTGTIIELKPIPVDPRSLFQGDYIALNYSINTIDTEVTPADPEITGGNDVYVVLTPTDDGYAASEVKFHRPAAGTFIKGRVRYVSEYDGWRLSVREDDGNVIEITVNQFREEDIGKRIAFPKNTNNRWASSYMGAADAEAKRNEWMNGRGELLKGRRVHVRQLYANYGIETYYVERGAKRTLDLQRDIKNMTVRVALRKDGKGIIAGIMLDGTEIR